MAASCLSYASQTLSRDWRYAVSGVILIFGWLLAEAVLRIPLFYTYSWDALSFIYFFAKLLIPVYLSSRLQIQGKMKDSVKLLALLATAISVVLLTNMMNSNSNEGLQWEEFQAWTHKYGQEYLRSEEMRYRFEIFKQNRAKVHEHNKLAQSGRYKYFMALNQFATTTEKQYKHQYSYFPVQGIPAHPNPLLNITLKCTGSIPDSPNPPTDVNWTEKAVNKDVRQEGKCSANWAFSSVAAVEGEYAIKQEKLIKLSDQQIIDCSGDYGNEGCGGGFMEQAYWYMIDQGMANDKSYPYAGVTQNCRYSQSQKVVKVGKCARVPSRSYDKLISAVIQQPVTVSVASQKFMLYDRGIFDGECPLDLDRGMLLVGYGTENEVDYWTLKNSLGISWGEKGYMRLKRTAEEGPGMCGIQLAASIPQSVE